MGLKNKNTGQRHKKSACNQTGASNSLGPTGTNAILIQVGGAVRPYIYRNHPETDFPGNLPIFCPPHWYRPLRRPLHLISIFA